MGYELKKKNQSVSSFLNEDDEIQENNWVGQDEFSDIPSLQGLYFPNHNWQVNYMIP